MDNYVMLPQVPVQVGTSKKKKVCDFLNYTKESIRDSYDVAIQKLPGRRSYHERYSPRRLTADLSVCYPAPANISRRKLSLTSRPSQYMTSPGTSADHESSANSTPRDLSNFLSLIEISHGYFTAHIKCDQFSDDDILLLACSDRIEVLGRGHSRNSDQSSLPSSNCSSPSSSPLTKPSKTPSGSQFRQLDDVATSTSNSQLSSSFGQSTSAEHFSPSSLYSPLLAKQNCLRSQSILNKSPISIDSRSTRSLSVSTLITNSILRDVPFTNSVYSSSATCLSDSLLANNEELLESSSIYSSETMDLTNSYSSHTSTKYRRASNFTRNIAPIHLDTTTNLASVNSPVSISCPPSGQVRRCDYRVMYGYIRLPVYVDVPCAQFQCLANDAITIKAPTKGFNGSHLNKPRKSASTEYIKTGDSGLTKSMGRRNTIDLNSSDVKLFALESR